MYCWAISSFFYINAVFDVLWRCDTVLKWDCVNSPFARPLTIARTGKWSHWSLRWCRQQPAFQFAERHANISAAHQPVNWEKNRTNKEKNVVLGSGWMSDLEIVVTAGTNSPASHPHTYLCLSAFYYNFCQTPDLSAYTYYFSPFTISYVFFLRQGHCNKNIGSHNVTLRNSSDECRYCKPSLPLSRYYRVIFTVLTVLPWNFPSSRSNYGGYRGITVHWRKSRRGQRVTSAPKCRMGER